MHCFICGGSATSVRSLTQLTTAPTGPHDAVPVCPACQEDWSFSLLSIVSTDLAGLHHLVKPPPSPAPDPRHNNHPTP